MVQLAETIWRDYVIDGMPSSGAWNARKRDIRDWGAWLESIISALTLAGGKLYASKAAMNADTAPEINTPAIVLGDAIAANNGLYRKSAAAGVAGWTRVGDVPGYSFIKATDAGAGTPNAIEATSAIPIPTVDGGGLIALNIFETNTGSPVTVAFNGGAVLTIKTNSGNDVVAGGLVAGMTVAGYVSGSTFRLLSDQASSAILAAVEAAADATAADRVQTGLDRVETAANVVAAQEARDDALAAANATGPVTIYDTMADATAELASHVDGDVIEVLADEDHGELRTRYRREAGAWVFKIYMARDALSLINASRFRAIGDGVTDSKAAFIAAAAAAVALGQDVITADPGLYLAPGLTCDDMFGVYIVGDGIVFKNVSYSANNAYVFPFSLANWARRNKAYASAGGQRGMVGIELDDALSPHWADLFPLIGELGVPIGIVWPTADGSLWIKEAYRHGHEIIAHGLDNTTFVSMTDGEIEASAQSQIASVSAITGHSDNIAFVYPQHSRDARTDTILKKYFTRGRGREADTAYPMDAGHPWLVPAYATGSQRVGGEMSVAFKEHLRSIAAGNMRQLLYLHYTGAAQKEDELSFIRKMIEYIQDLGIRIEKPSNVLGNTQVNRDPYFKEAALGDAWVAGSGNQATLSLSSEESYHGGQSLKVQNLGAGNQDMVFRSTKAILNPRPGKFSLYRFSVRRKHAEHEIATANFGLRFHMSYTGVSSVDSAAGGGGSGDAGLALHRQLGSTILPAADWTVFERIIAIPPKINSFFPHLKMNAILPGEPPMYFDEFRVEYLNAVPTLRQRLTLNGTVAVTVFTGIVDWLNVGVSVAPLASVAGEVYVTPVTSTAGAFSVRSTNAADTAQVDLIFTPPSFYHDVAIGIVL